MVMTMPERETEPNDSWDFEQRTRYTYDEVAWLLEHCRYRDAKLGPHAENLGNQTNRPRLDSEKAKLSRYLDVARAVLWLGTADPIASDAIWGVYIEGKGFDDVAQDAKRQRARPTTILDINADDVSRWQGITVHELHKRIRRGINKIVPYLNAQQAREDRLHPFRETPDAPGCA